MKLEHLYNVLPEKAKVRLYAYDDEDDIPISQCHGKNEIPSIYNDMDVVTISTDVGGYTCIYLTENLVEKNTDDGSDSVNHPAHYVNGDIETIDVIKAWTEGLDGIEAVDAGNVIKYISRFKKKNGLEDLRKAKWYLEHLISVWESKQRTYSR